MKTAAPSIAAAITNVVRADRGRLLSALIAGLRDFQLAEDSLQEALEAAVVHWTRSGLPSEPRAWLLRVARRKAIDRIRRAGRWRERVADIAAMAEADQAAAADPPPDIPDERLRLIFTCCHPALDPKSRVALTLRTLGGLSTAEIARVFLDREHTMGQRLSRARSKISRAGIPYAVPGPADWSARLNSVLTVIYLIFTRGHAVTSGEASTGADLCHEALWLGRMLNELQPGEAEVLGLLSLMLTTDARRQARFDDKGCMVSLDDQNRQHWDGSMIDEGLACLDQAIALRIPGPFQIKAAISALHAQAITPDATDWRQMILLYDALLAHEPTAVVALNRAVALAEAGAEAAAMTAIDGLAGALDDYQPFHAARASLLEKAGRIEEAHQAYDRACGLSQSRSERAFLKKRQKGLRAPET
ncbi:MAG: sigma-70 family RNA polymerase sigma factor [Albidovulum sp.]